MIHAQDVATVMSDEMIDLLTGFCGLCPEMFSVLLPASYKEKNLTELLPLLFGLEHHDWAVMSYGLELGDKKQPTPIAAGIPTTCGSIVFSNLSFDASKLLEFAREELPEEKFNELKERVASEEILGDELRYEIGEKLANSVALRHPDVLDYLQYELLVAIPANPLANQEEDKDTDTVGSRYGRTEESGIQRRAGGPGSSTTSTDRS